MSSINGETDRPKTNTDTIRIQSLLNKRDSEYESMTKAKTSVNNKLTAVDEDDEDMLVERENPSSYRKERAEAWGGDSILSH